MKSTEHSVRTVEIRLEEIVRLVLPEVKPDVDFDTVTMGMKDGATILTLELRKTR